MKLRRATTADAAAVSRLLAAVWPDAYRGIFPDAFLDGLDADGWTHGFQAALSDGAAVMLLAEDGGQLLGMVFFGTSRLPEQPQDGEIYALNVLPAAQGRGIGRRLMAAAQTALRQSGHRAVSLCVVVQNRRARDFYRRLGFADTGARHTRVLAGFEVEEAVYRCCLNATRQA